VVEGIPLAEPELVGAPLTQYASPRSKFVQPLFSCGFHVNNCDIVTPNCCSIPVQVSPLAITCHVKHAPVVPGGVGAGGATVVVVPLPIAVAFQSAVGKMQ
jgi:hypothetical protein